MVKADILTITFDNDHYDEAVLLVLSQLNGISNVRRMFTGDEAIELYNNLVGKEKLNGREES